MEKKALRVTQTNFLELFFIIRDSQFPKKRYELYREP